MHVHAQLDLSVDDLMGASAIYLTVCSLLPLMPSQQPEHNATDAGEAAINQSSIDTADTGSPINEMRRGFQPAADTTHEARDAMLPPGSDRESVLDGQEAVRAAAHIAEALDLLPSSRADDAGEDGV